MVAVDEAIECPELEVFSLIRPTAREFWAVLKVWTTAFALEVWLELETPFELNDSVAEE